MRRFIAASFIGIILLGMFTGSVPAAQAAPLSPGISVTITPGELVPAQAGFVVISGGYPLDASVTLAGKPLPVYWSGSAYVGVFAFGFEAEPGDYQLAVSVENPATGAHLDRNETLTVLNYSYPQEQVALPYKLIPLLDPEMNIAEMERLDTIYEARSYPNRWDWPFAIPMLNPVVTSRFGGDRTYNGGLWYAYHTGVDFRSSIGDPVLATAGGRVAAAEALNVRGNVVIIDHGFGVMSQYAHLSEVAVQPGQWVEQSQLIGLTGETGRTNGPHLHFEIVVNSHPVDPIRWFSLDPDFVPPREIRPENDDAAPED